MGKVISDRRLEYACVKTERYSIALSLNLTEQYRLGKQTVNQQQKTTIGKNNTHTRTHVRTHARTHTHKTNKQTNKQTTTTTTTTTKQTKTAVTMHAQSDRFVVKHTLLNLITLAKSKIICFFCHPLPSPSAPPPPSLLPKTSSLPAEKPMLCRRSEKD